MDDLLPLIGFVVLMVLAWKVLKGVIKTVALGALLVAVAMFVFGSEFGKFA